MNQLTVCHQLHGYVDEEDRNNDNECELCEEDLILCIKCPFNIPKKRKNKLPEVDELFDISKDEAPDYRRPVLGRELSREELLDVVSKGIEDEETEEVEEQWKKDYPVKGWICPVCGRGISPNKDYCNCKEA